jgi:hypothetical protein
MKCYSNGKFILKSVMHALNAVETLIPPARPGTHGTLVQMSRYTAMNSGETNLENEKVFLVLLLFKIR